MYNILCVDDTVANLFVLESLFEQEKDKYNIITAQSGVDGLEKLLKNSIDLILLDVMMPELNGFETAKLIKSNKKTKDIPIIFVTAKNDDETIQNSFEYGVDYLSKPYNECELLSRVDFHIQLIDTQRKLQEQVIFNQSVLDSQNNIIAIQGDEGIVTANKSFLNFFKLDSIEEFKKNHKCISELFMEYENYFSLHILNDNEPWTQIISDNKNNTYNVLIMDVRSFEPKAFQIDANNIKGSNKYVITLTDITKIATKSKHYENKATYDALTNIFNRSKFTEILELRYKQFLKKQDINSFAIFDIDFFKKINDTYGHIAGDNALIKFAQTIEEKCQKNMVFARWGGEEFVMLFLDTKLDEAVDLSDKIRQTIENTRFKEIDKVTCSIGVTQFKENDTIDAIIKRADDALYEAKQTGRNKVSFK